MLRTVTEMSATMLISAAMLKPMTRYGLTWSLPALRFQLINLAIKDQCCDDINLYDIDCLFDSRVNGNSSVLWKSIIG